ncbi:MAG: DUF1805 domain-containing protein [Chloroflexi bacterium]|nr:DUF1805 domain-containing protein [Chloroflexota bacterium]
MVLVSLLSTALAACGAPAPITGSLPAPTGSTTILPEKESKIVHQTVQLTNKQADGYIIPLGHVHIVCVVTDVGMVGCGAFDVMALDAFGIPAARVKSTSGIPIATIDELLDGVVKEVNTEAAKLGINIGMSGREALDLL